MRSPGKVLDDDFLKPNGVSRYHLSNETGITQSTLDRIVEKGGLIIPLNCLLLARFFDVDEMFFVNLQRDYTVADLKRRFWKRLGGEGEV